jgi:hypothetical protein
MYGRGNIDLLEPRVSAPVIPNIIKRASEPKNAFCVVFP